MKRAVLGIVCGVLLGIPLVVGGQGPSPSAPAKKPSAIDETMQHKQRLAHEVLDALVLKDFRRIYKNANSLIFLSKTVEFQVHRTPLYAQYTLDFQKAASKLGENAHDNNVDGTTRAFGELVLTCVSCHEYIRSRTAK